MKRGAISGAIFGGFLVDHGPGQLQYRRFDPLELGVTATNLGVFFGLFFGLLFGLLFAYITVLFSIFSQSELPEKGQGRVWFYRQNV